MRTLLRTNLCKNPRFVNPTSGLYWSWIGATLSNETLPVVGEVLKVTSTGVTSRATAVMLPGMQDAGTYSVSVRAMSPSATFTGFRFIFYNQTTLEISSQNVSFTPNNQFQYLSLTLSPTHTFDRVYCEFTGTAIQTGDIGYLHEPILEKASSVGLYFHGSSLETQTRFYKWNGMVDGSTSSEYRIDPDEWSAMGSSLANLKYKMIETILGPSPVKTMEGSLADIKKAALEKVLTDNGLV
jgi:hypothetical protein